MKKKERVAMLSQIEKQTQSNIASVIIDTLESNEMSAEDISINVNIKDKSRVKWKSKSHFIKLFTVEFKELLKDKKLDIEKVGFVTILASYIDYEDNYLRNEEGDYLSQKEIIEMTGFSRKKVFTLLKELNDDQIIFSFKQEGDIRKNRYYVNPELFYRGLEIDREIKYRIENLN